MHALTDSDTPAGPVILLAGQGSQFPGMGIELYRALPEFGYHVEEALTPMGHLGRRLLRDHFRRPAAASLDYDDACVAQPLILACGYAMTTLVMDYGLEPRALLGYSMGELAAAAAAGVIGLDDLGAFVVDRVARFALTPPGAMLAVSATTEEVADYLTGDTVVGAVNSPHQVVLCGARDDVATTHRRLSAAGIATVRVASHHAFHSALVAEACRQSKELLASCTLSAPRVPLISSWAAGPLTDVEATSHDTWLMQSAEPVCFDRALSHAMTVADCFVEAGPGRSLTLLARRHRDLGPRPVVPLIPGRPRTPGQELTLFQRGLATLEASGHDLGMLRATA